MFLDERNPSGLLETEEDLLYHMAANHVTVSLDAHAKSTKANALEAELALLMEKLDHGIKLQAASPSIGSAQRELVREWVGLAGDRGVMTAIHALLEELKGRADAAAKAKDALTEKHLAIVDSERKLVRGASGIGP